MFELSETLKIFLELSRQKKQKIVFTNGCFDILHSGHAQYLNEAKKCGDILIVGLNSDSSVKRLKGAERPINRQADRKYLLENLKAVDFVEIFNEDTPYELISALKPHILVKGGDWKKEQIVGHDIVTALGGEVRSLSFKEGYSTTNIIETLKSKP